MSDLSEEVTRPLYRHEYERMIEVGLFAGEGLELLAGALICMEPQGPSHADVTSRLARLLFAAIGARAVIRSHSPFALSDESEPEPDLAIVPLGDYSSAHPARALLLVEVADSSLRRDRGIKAGLYAAAGVPEYWLVNLVDRAVEVHRSPQHGRYGDVTRAVGDAPLRPLAFPDVALRVDAVLEG